MNNINKLYILAIVVIIIGTIICKVKGFNIELEYKNRQEINISTSQEIDIKKVEEISKSVLQGKKNKVKEIGTFKNAVKIISTEITNEEKDNIINKINEEYKSSISTDEIDVINIPNTRIRDIIKPFILTGIIASFVVIVYFIIMYNQIGFKKVFLKSLFTPVCTEIIYYSIIAIVRIPLGRVTNSIAIGVYFISILVLAACFQNEKTNKFKDKENDE